MIIWVKTLQLHILFQVFQVKNAWRTLTSFREAIIYALSVGVSTQDANGLRLSATSFKCLLQLIENSSPGSYMRTTPSLAPCPHLVWSRLWVAPMVWSLGECLDSTLISLRWSPVCCKSFGKQYSCKGHNCIENTKTYFLSLHAFLNELKGLGTSLKSILSFMLSLSTQGLLRFLKQSYQIWNRRLFIVNDYRLTKHSNS